MIKSIKRVLYSCLLRIKEPRKQIISLYPSSSAKRIKLFHISAFSYGNAGDTLLPVALRDLLNKEICNFNWKVLHVHKKVMNHQVTKFNKSKGIIIGGGGLFLSDTNKNDISGWQWTCPIEELKAITKPIILFAVGYNRFRDQPDFPPVFREHINLLASKSRFIGLRNNGSINKIKEYIEPEFHSRVKFQPCMTTILSKIYPDFEDYNQKQEFLAVNCAFDRSHLRFGRNIDKILKGLAVSIKDLSKDHPIKYYSHMDSDEAFLPFLDAHNISYDLVRLTGAQPKKIIAEYAKPKLVIGMRGHSQMIPFGCNTPILTLISHDKMKWFLDDIIHPEWGIEINSPTLRNDLVSSVQNILNNYQDTTNHILNAQNKLYRISQKNIAEIKKHINL